MTEDTKDIVAIEYELPPAMHNIQGLQIVVQGLRASAVSQYEPVTSSLSHDYGPMGLSIPENQACAITINIRNPKEIRTD